MPSKSMIEINRSVAQSHLMSRLSESEHLGSNPDSEKFRVWHRITRLNLKKIFGEGSTYTNDFDRIAFAPHDAISAMDLELCAQYHNNGLSHARALLEEAVHEILHFTESGDPDGSNSQRPLSSIGKNIATNSKVFVVHGHDDGSKNEVARFIEKLKLEAVILHERPNRGRTLIEKFEEYADVGFAIVILSPDDFGSSIKAPGLGRPRARQNVIFELGFFLGKLGRDRVCALHFGEIEIPSDYQGVAYVQKDLGGAWKIELIKELTAAGYEVDSSHLFK